MDGQTILALVIVAVAGAFLCRRWFQSAARGGRCGCGDTCGAAPTDNNPVQRRQIVPLDDLIDTSVTEDQS